MSLTGFHKLRVQKLVKETKDAVCISFKIPFDLKESFNFIPGQYLTLRTTAIEEDLRRCYSIYSMPGDDLISVAVKKLPGGRFSTWANEQLIVGDELEVMAPNGTFLHYCSTAEDEHYLCVAAGSGITPILSIVQTILETELTNRVTLVFGNQKASTILFRQKLEQIKNRFIDRFQMIHVLSRESRDVPALDGRINSEKLMALTPNLFDLKTVSKTFICGPEALINEVSNGLKESGLNEEEIYYELFGTSNLLGQAAVTNVSASLADVGNRSVVTLIVDGRHVRLEVGSNGKSILDSALDVNLDLPFACKGGVCGTCRAKVVKGDVRMDSQSVLSVTDVEKGAVLTCRAHPVSAEVFINFDKAL